MTTPTDLKQLERDYMRLLAVAELANYDLTPDFARELEQLTKTLKAMGSKIV